MRAPKYLRVDCTYKPDGTIVPLILYWDDKPFTIDRILDVRPGVSLKHGGAGMCYTVRIRDSVRRLILSQNKWYVEEKDSPA